MVKKIISTLEKLKNPQKAHVLQRFFKTGKGEYGEGDVFWGITVPKQREVARKFYKEITLTEIEKLLHNKVHEHRLTALLILVSKYKKADKPGLPAEVSTKAGGLSLQENIFKLYLRNTKWINNWDLVDLSAPNIVGEYLYTRSAVNRRNVACLPASGGQVPTIENEKQIIYKLAKSVNLWERRISIISTFTFIRKNDFVPTIKIAEMLLHNKHDLIHKAVGWMLREVGKRDKKTLIAFLNKHHKKMPRVMLRYAIEKFGKNERKKYLL